MASYQLKLHQKNKTINDKYDDIAGRLLRIEAINNALQQENQQLRAERDKLAKKFHDKPLICSALKHSFRELSAPLLNDNLLGEVNTNDHAETSKPSRQLAKTPGSTTNLNLNEDHRFAASHTICYFKTKTVCTFIPKNACSNLRYSIAMANGAIKGEEEFDWIHSNNNTFIAGGIKDLAEAEYTFVILRNPFTRLVSFFLDKLSGNGSSSNDHSYKKAKELFSDIPKEITFRSFVNNLWVNPEKLTIDHHIRPQVDFLVYQDYDDWFCLEKLEHAAKEIEAKAGFKFHDTRRYSRHASSMLNVIKEKKFFDTEIGELNELQSAGQIPCPTAMYDDELAFKVHAMYLSDVRLYGSKFGERNLSQWLERSKKHVCAQQIC